MKTAHIISLDPPYIAWPWRLRWIDGNAPAKGLRCQSCNRDVAAVASSRRAICIYCAMDRGLIGDEMPF